MSWVVRSSEGLCSNNIYNKIDYERQYVERVNGTQEFRELI